MRNQASQMSSTASLKNLAAERAKILVGCYRKSDANDPVVYAAAVVAVLLKYPSWVMTEVTEPASGIPAKIKWLPSIAEIVEACDAAIEPMLRQRQRERIAETARLAPPTRERLSEAELDAQFERLGLKHLRPGSKFGTRQPRFSDNEARQAQATLDRYAAEAKREPAREAAE